MSAIAASRALVPHSSPASADVGTRIAVSLSMLSWLTVVVTLFWH